MLTRRGKTRMDGVGIVFKLYMGICPEKCHFGFSKSSKFKRVVLLILMTFCVYVQQLSILPYEVALK